MKINTNHIPNSSKEILTFSLDPCFYFPFLSLSENIISYSLFFTFSLLKNTSMIALFSNSVNYYPLILGIVLFDFLLSRISLTLSSNNFSSSVFSKTFGSIFLVLFILIKVYYLAFIFFIFKLFPFIFFNEDAFFVFSKVDNCSVF